MALCGDYITMRPSAKKVLLLVELLWGKGWEQEPGKVLCFLSRVILFHLASLTQQRHVAHMSYVLDKKSTEGRMP